MSHGGGSSTWMDTILVAESTSFSVLGMIKVLDRVQDLVLHPLYLCVLRVGVTYLYFLLPHPRWPISVLMCLRLGIPVGWPTCFGQSRHQSGIRGPPLCGILQLCIQHTVGETFSHLPRHRSHVRLAKLLLYCLCDWTALATRQEEASVSNRLLLQRIFHCETESLRDRGTWAEKKTDTETEN